MLSLTLGSPAKDTTYETRTAVRCIIINNDQICIIHVKKGTYVPMIGSKSGISLTRRPQGNYYKLPGGGVEPEDPNDEVACQREALEETGCEVIVRPGMIAQTIEYRGTLHQESHAYVCTVRNDTGRVELTDLEASEGLAHLWCSIAEALQKMKDVEPSTELGEFIKKRDVFLLETYLQI
jgi:8-oxo-dGTP diphosphatase